MTQKIFGTFLPFRRTKRVHDFLNLCVLFGKIEPFIERRNNVGQWLFNKLYQPVVFFFLFPVFYLLLGFLTATAYNPFRWLPALLLYVFVLVNQMLENMLLRIPNNDYSFSRGFFILLELLNVLLLFYFGWQYSWIAALVLFLFTFLIQVQFLLTYYDLDDVGVLAAAFLKVFLLNGFAFYTQTNFIHTRFFPLYIGMLLPFYLFEVSRGDSQLQKKWLDGILLLSIAVGVISLWQFTGQWSLLLLLALPIALFVYKEFNRKTTAVYTFIYALLYFSLYLFNRVGD